MPDLVKFCQKGHPDPVWLKLDSISFRFVLLCRITGSSETLPTGVFEVNFVHDIASWSKDFEVVGKHGIGSRCTQVCRQARRQMRKKVSSYSNTNWRHQMPTHLVVAPRETSRVEDSFHSLNRFNEAKSRLAPLPAPTAIYHNVGAACHCAPCLPYDEIWDEVMLLQHTWTFKDLTLIKLFFTPHEKRRPHTLRVVLALKGSK